MNKKVVCIVQVRMGSKRFPGKVIRNLCGKPMIKHIIDRLSESKKINEIIVATSINKENDILENILKDSDVKIFRGDEENVLKRYVDVVKKYGGDYIIRVTGDCPLISCEIIDELINQFKNSNYEYMRVDIPNTICRGFDAEIFNKETLIKTYKFSKTLRDREHVTIYIYEHPEKFLVGIMKAKTKWQRPQYRLTVDTIEDFKMINKIYENLYKEGEYISIDEIIKFLDANPDIVKINCHIKQKKT